MADKSTHALARVREFDGRDTNEVFKLPTPTTDAADAFVQWERANTSGDADAPSERLLIDVTLLAPGQEKVRGGPPERPKAAPVAARVPGTK